MASRRKIVAWVAAFIILGVVVGSVSMVLFRRYALKPISITGVVLRSDSDPRKQVPIPFAEITATNGRYEITGKSDTSGFFQLTLRPTWEPRPNTTLLIRHAEYRPLEIGKVTGDRIYVARMEPKTQPEAPTRRGQSIKISDLRVRYSVKAATTVNVGSMAKTFEAPNTGGIPCANQPPCSADGKWKATLTSQTFDAEERNQFHNVRLACVAGPCPFTKVESGDLVDPGRIIRLSLLNWSDTTTFLLEAEVTHPMISDIVRQSYPPYFGPAMNFTLPATAEGPSIEAKLNGTDIVFPLGPALHLSWAECTMSMAADRTKQFRCELKPGYEFELKPGSESQ